MVRQQSRTYRNVLTVSIGDTLVKSDRPTGQLRPTKQIEWIEDWLRSDFSMTFRNDENTLPRGIQKDGFSCGPGVVNIVKSDIFGVPLFTHHRRAVIRMSMFLAVAKAQLDMVSC